MTWSKLFTNPSGLRGGDPFAVSQSPYTQSFENRLAIMDHEEVWAVVFGKKPIAMPVAKGGLYGVPLSVPDVAGASRVLHSRRVILVHNHPSGNPNPSQGDILMTELLLQSETFELVEHFVVASRGVVGIVHGATSSDSLHLEYMMKRAWRR